jgi:hypothetical protein
LPILRAVPDAQDIDGLGADPAEVIVEFVGSQCDQCVLGSIQQK